MERVRDLPCGPTVIRSIRPEDALSLQDFHEHLSERTVRLRFLAAKPHLTQAEAGYFTHVDNVRRVALVAHTEGTLIGVGRFDAIDARRAEVAFVVRDDFQGNGLGSWLLSELIEEARDRSFSEFIADVEPSNARMLRTFEHAGVPMESRLVDGLIAVRLSLRGDLATTDGESR